MLPTYLYTTIMGVFIFTSPSDLQVHLFENNKDRSKPKIKGATAAITEFVLTQRAL